MSAALDELLRQLADPDEVLGDTDRYEMFRVEQLSPDERAVFVAKLTEAAVSREDRRAILTLGLMNATEARGALFPLGARADHLGRLARRTLVMLGDGLSFVNEIAADVLNQEAKFYRGDAVEDLGKLRGSPVARSTLLQALDDPEDRTRVAAFKALLEWYGLTERLKGPEGWPDLTTELELQGVFLDRDLPAFVRIGVTELRRVFGWLDSGVPPEALGIAWSAKPHEELFDRVRGVLFEPAEPFPLEELSQLKGTWRRWGEAMIAFRLVAHDPRVPDAMIRLGAAWTLPVLTSVAEDEKVPAELRAELKRAAGVLAPLARPPWQLAFASTRPVPLATYEQVLASVLEAPVMTDSGELRGNPRDGYFGDVTLTAERAHDRSTVTLSFQQTAWFPGDSNPELELKGATLRSMKASFEEKLVLWQALRAALEVHGCSDATLTASPAPIVDEADPESAKKLRARITSAWLAKAPSLERVWLVSPRIDDVPAVLSAFTRAERIEHVTLDDCDLVSLPAALSRFQAATYLSLAKNPLDAEALRALSLPRLEMLSLLACPMSALAAGCLAGFPKLKTLVLSGTPLEWFDPGIFETCPELKRVLVSRTPLERDVAGLRERWRDVTWE